MPRVSFKCPECSRTFKMAAHLARHRNTMHGAGGKRKTTKTGRRPGRPRKGTSAGRTPRVLMSTNIGGETSRFLADMEVHHANLLAQRATLDAQIDAIAGAMSVLNAAPSSPTTGTRKRGRPKGSVNKIRRTGGKKVAASRGPRKAGSLKDYIVRVLGTHSKPLSPQDIGQKVMKAGFKTKSKDLTKAVSNALPTLKKVKRVGFGQYQMN